MTRTNAIVVQLLGVKDRLLIVATSIGPKEVFSRDFYRHGGGGGRWWWWARNLAKIEIKD